MCVLGGEVLFFIRREQEERRVARHVTLTPRLSLRLRVESRSHHAAPPHTASSPGLLAAAAAAGSITHSCACSFHC